MHVLWRCLMNWTASRLLKKVIETARETYMQMLQLCFNDLRYLKSMQAGMRYEGN